MHEKFHPSYTALPPERATLVWQTLHSRRMLDAPCPPDADGEELLVRVETAGLGHADVVLALASSADWMALDCIQRLTGRPITVCPPRMHALGWNDEPVLRPNGEPLVPEHMRPDRQPPRPRSAPVRIDTRIIEWVAENPKKKGSASWDRFGLYRVGARLQDLYHEGLRPEDVRWDEPRGFIRLRPPTAEEQRS